MSDDSQSRLIQLRTRLEEFIAWAEEQGEFLLAAKLAEALECKIKKAPQP